MFCIPILVSLVRLMHVYKLSQLLQKLYPYEVKSLS